MPSPKSGNAPAAVAPSEPKKAEEADKADPGEMTEVKARQLETQTGKYGTPPSDAHNPSDEENKKKTSWIEIALVYESNGKPVPGVAYEVTLPDGQTVASGSTDEKGLARVSGIDPGSCQISFPNLDKEAWEDA
jgi:type VI secretion system secreted protein VgrG